MRTRTIEEIEAAFREIGLTEETWGRSHSPTMEVGEGPTAPQVFIRIETVTTPLDEKTSADLA